MTHRKHYATTALAAALAVVAGCASNENHPALQQARAAVGAAENDPDVIESASVELERAREALAVTEAHFAEEGDSEPARLEHLAYLTTRLAELAESQAQAARLDDEIENAEAERNEVLLAARSAEARRAETEALRQAQAADAALGQAEQAQARASQLESRAAQSERRAEVAAVVAGANAAENQRLQQRIEELQMEQTERGLVLTLGDVLFDVDEAELKPGADTTIDRLVEFLEEYDDRVVQIEGHTDSTGAESYNEQLSERRANAVRDALMQRGVAADRIETLGLGESSPVATNSTVAGRQQNRRVEVVISNEQGQFQGGQRPPAG